MWPNSFFPSNFWPGTYWDKSGIDSVTPVNTGSSNYLALMGVGSSIVLAILNALH